MWLLSIVKGKLYTECFYEPVIWTLIDRTVSVVVGHLALLQMLEKELTVSQLQG